MFNDHDKYEHLNRLAITSGRDNTNQTNMLMSTADSVEKMN